MDRVTVAICTWNRALLLDQTLAEMRKLRIPAGVDFELLVVNNNCTDDTDEVIGRHQAALPIRRLFEPKPGLSNARNCAVDAAQGEMLIWTDDDVLVDPDWLWNYVLAAREWPEAMFFGGTIDPWFAVEPPLWISHHFRCLRARWAIRQLGEETMPIPDGAFPFGANMAFRTGILKSRRFDERLGRKASGLLGLEETEILESLASSGHTGIWVGKARVRHYIPRERLTKTYLWKFEYNHGRSMYLRGKVASGPSILGAPRWVIRKYVESLAVATCLAPLQSRKWLDAFLSAAYYRGIIDEARGLARR